LSTFSSKPISSKSCFSSTSNLKESSIKGFITRCLPLLGCLTGFVRLCFTLRAYKCTMTCWYGMLREWVINYTTKIMKRIVSLWSGGNGWASTIRDAISSWFAVRLIGDKIIFYHFFSLGMERKRLE
jgi:hypothetical protein